MPDNAAIAATQALVEKKAPRSLASRLAMLAGVAVVAFGIHSLAGGRWTAVLVAATAITALLALFPRLTWLVKPVGVYAGLWLVFNVLRAYADDTEWANRVLDLVPQLEGTIFAGHFPSATLQDWFYQPGSSGWIEYGLVAIYMSFFAVPHLVAALLIWRNRRLFWHYTIATGLLFAMATVSFFLIPTAPPWLASEIAAGMGFPPVQRITEPVLAGLDLPIQLFSESTRAGVRTSEVRMEPNPIAAMPSIHLAATMMVALPARRAGMGIFSLGVAYTGLMGLALVYLGEHYVVDLVAGGTMVLVSWIFAERLLNGVRFTQPAPERGRLAHEPA